MATLPPPSNIAGDYARAPHKRRDPRL